jgi:ABC-2 type transport system permease protein
LSIPLVVAAVLVVVAFVLESRRDFASGLRPTRLGPAVASPRLGSAAGLAWRLLRGSWVAWVLGIAVFSAVLGTVAKGVLDIFKDNPELEKIFREMGGSTGTVVDALFAALLPVVGMIATVHAVTIVLRIRTEEVDLRAEQVLATATTRPRMYVSYVAHAVVSPFVLMVIAGASAGGAYAVTVHDSSQVLRVTGAAFATVPAMLVVIGLAAALVGFLPQNAPVIWAVLGYSVAVGQVGPLLKFPTWALKTSPFGNIPPLPGSHVSAAPILVMSSVGVVLLVLGLVGFRRRDIG